MHNGAQPLGDFSLFITTYKKQEVTVKPVKERVLKPQVSLPTITSNRPRRLQKLPSEDTGVVGNGWKHASIPHNNVERLEKLRGYNILDTAPEVAFDDIARMAAAICGTPMAAISMVDKTRQWFKSRVGIDTPEIPIDMSFCAHTILEVDGFMEVKDTSKDVRFFGNPIVATPEIGIRFYAGATLMADNHALGTICVLDNKPWQLETHQIDSLRALSRLVVNQLEARSKNDHIAGLQKQLQDSQLMLERANLELQANNAFLQRQLKELNEKQELLLEAPAGKVVEFLQLILKQIPDEQQRNLLRDTIKVIASHKLYDVDVAQAIEAGAVAGAVDEEMKGFLLTQLQGVQGVGFNKTKHNHNNKNNRKPLSKEGSSSNLHNKSPNINNNKDILSGIEGSKLVRIASEKDQTHTTKLTKTNSTDVVPTTINTTTKLSKVGSTEFVPATSKLPPTTTGKLTKVPSHEVYPNHNNTTTTTTTSKLTKVGSHEVYPNHNNTTTPKLAASTSAPSSAKFSDYTTTTTTTTATATATATTTTTTIATTTANIPTSPIPTPTPTSTSISTPSSTTTSPTINLSSPIKPTNGAIANYKSTLTAPTPTSPIPSPSPSPSFGPSPSLTSTYGSLGQSPSFGTSGPLSRTGSAFSIDGEAPPPTDFKQFVAQIDDWDFDVFAFSAISHNQPLLCASLALFAKYEFLRKMSISSEKLINFLTDVENGYIHENPYHNNIHATDVVLGTNYLAHASGVLKYMSVTEHFALLLAAAVHDLGHLAVNNTFLVQTGHELALTHNDKSVLENHHCSTAFKLIKKNDFLEKLSVADRQDIRKIMIELILATDMSQHVEIFNNFQNKKNTSEGLNLEDKQDRMLVLKVLIKCADISNSAKKKELYLNWAGRVMEEFWLQGDKERALGMPVSAFMDRTQPDVNKCQSAFIQFIAVPFYTSLVAQFPSLEPCLLTMKANLAHWKSSR